MYESATAWRYLFRPRLTTIRWMLAATCMLVFLLGTYLLYQAWAPGRTLSLVLFGLGVVLSAGNTLLVLLFKSTRYRLTTLRAFLLGLWYWLGVIGAALVFAPDAEYAGAILMGLGGLTFVAFLLSLCFSMFTTVSILAVFVAVSTMILVRSVTNGFSQEFKDKVLGFNAHVLVMKWGYGLTEYRQVIREVKRLPHVKGAAPFTIADMLVARGAEHTHVLMKGVEPETVHEVLDLIKYVRARDRADLERRIRLMEQHLDKGGVGPNQPGGCEPKLDEDGDPIPGSRRSCKLPGIMLGTRLAERLKVREGDIVRLISPTAEVEKLRGEVRASAPPVARDFRVVGLFYCGFEEYDQKLVFVHLKAAQQFTTPGTNPDEDAVLGVEIKLDDIYLAADVAAQIQRRLGKQPYRVITWMELNKPLFSALRTQRMIMIIISVILLIVAAFCILASLAMMVIDKTREVAILRSMGVSAGGVARVFLMVSLIIGIVGVGMGVGFGLVMCDTLGHLDFPLDPKVYLISRLPVLVDYVEISVVVGAALVLCFVAALYPAFRASSLRPVEGLRYE